MNNVFGDVSIKRLDAMQVASYRVISKNPEDEAIVYMKNWLMNNGLDKQEGMQNFGFDIPVDEQQRNEELRGYEYWVTVPDTATESSGVKIKNIDADEYAVLRITDPFNNPFYTIPAGWKILKEWVMSSEYKPTCNYNRYWLEEVIEDGKNTYMDIYFPVKDGGRKVNAEIAKLSIVELNACKLIGKEIKCTIGHPNGNLIPALWSQCCKDGTLKRLEVHPDRLYCNACIGWMGNFNFSDKTFAYVVGVFAKANAIVPEGLVSIDIPNMEYAVGTIEGIEPDIYMNEHSFTENEMKKAGLEYDESLGFEMEWYDERFSHNEGYKIIDLYIPIC